MRSKIMHCAVCTRFIIVRTRGEKLSTDSGIVIRILFICRIGSERMRARNRKNSGKDKVFPFDNLMAKTV